MSERSGRHPQRKKPQRKSVSAGNHASTRSQERPRNRTRKGLSLPMRLLIIVITVGLLGTAAFFLSRYLDGAWNAKQAINAAISDVEQSDENITALNNLVTSTVDDLISADTTSLAKDLQESAQNLNDAEQHLAEAEKLDEFMDDNQRSICEALHASINARRKMISAGETIVAVDTRVGEARSLLDQAIEKALAADEKSREATQAANEYALYLTGNSEVTTTDATVAVNLDNEAITLLDEASAALDSAKEAFGEADYSLYETYLEKRKEAAQLMLDADNAIVSGDFASTSEKTDSYNEADSAATEAAAALPSSTAEIFSEPYAQLTAESRATYTEAYANAAEADALIRHYEGVSVQVSTEASTEVSTTNEAETAATADAISDNVAATSSETTTKRDIIIEDSGTEGEVAASTTNADSVVTVQ